MSKVAYIIKYSSTGEVIGMHTSYYARCNSGNGVGYDLNTAILRGTFKTQSRAEKVADTLRNSTATVEVIPIEL
jgi:hypothetical protein